MEIVGLGTAVVECLFVRRLLDRHGERFLGRAYTERETRYCQSRRRPAEQFAAWWAAKEATLKALGVASRRGLGMVEVELWPGADGQPRVLLRGAVRERARERAVARLLLTTAHCRTAATATAVALRPPAIRSDSPAGT